VTTLKLGTRGSALALTQSRWVASEIEKHNDGVKVELVIIKTQGDRDQNSALNKFAGKGIFTKEIEDALLASEIDLAVHSLKDLPTTLPPGLALADPPRREDPRDLLVSNTPLRDLPKGAVVGTGSSRRREQLRLIRPDLKFAEIRGNVPTRVGKWRDGQYDATVLACAGVARLGPETAGLNHRESHPLSVEDCLPAPAQGILGLEIRENDDSVRGYLANIACPETVSACAAERGFLAELDGGCHIPAGALAQVKDGEFTVVGFLAVEDADGTFRGERAQKSGPIESAESLGRDVARILKSRS
jgi:hydroxymethylbilane synthase